MGAAVYILGTATTLLCAVLLLRGYLRTRLLAVPPTTPVVERAVLLWPRGVEPAYFCGPSHISQP